MQLKNKANTLLKEKKYNKAIELYTQLLDYNNDYNILSNRGLAYIKIGNLDKALIDLVNSTKLNPECAKTWGRLGAVLYKTNKLSESLTAYTKAYELENNKIYLNMINEIKKKSLLTNNKMFTTLFNSVITNKKIMGKLTDPEVQRKILSFRSINIVEDEDIKDIMKEMSNCL